MRVVIVGGGFGGLNAALALRRVDVQVTLVDRENYHLFQPLLYQVATGSLSPANICAPLRNLLRRYKHVDVLQAEVVDFDLAARQVKLADRSLPFDYLVVATGMTHSYFGHEDDWQPLAPGLKSIPEATEIRARVLSAFERAEWEPDEGRRQHLLTFAIVGGGPTGVELAGTLADLARHTLRNEFRHIKTPTARVVLVDAVPHVLSNYPVELSEKARASLARLGVEVHTGVRVTAIDERGIQLEGSDELDRIDAETVLWAAGVKASPLGHKLTAAAGADLLIDRAGRPHVEPDLSLPGYPTVFVIGDLAHCEDDSGKVLPGVAPVAIQQGKYVARLIGKKLAGKTLPPFRYRDYGSMATIGRAAAVAKIGRLEFSGYLAWLAWLFIHLMQLVNFQNRALVFVQWTWSYVTRGRSARLITTRPSKPASPEPTTP